MMRWPKSALLIILVLLVCSGLASAEKGNIKLLAVQQDGDEMRGSIADLYLEIKPGEGRVFVDTFPLTKIDTQVSTRFAKEIACDYLEADCERYDFFYTIRANSPIIAGPSAGAAITALTISMLGNFDISKDVAITGTINSGGIVGPVGGVQQKIEAASENGIEKVLIPYGERFVRNESFVQLTIEDVLSNESYENVTAKELLGEPEKLDLVEYGESLGIEVIEVSDINDVIYEFSGLVMKGYDENITIDESYSRTMSALAEQLCERGKKLSANIAEDGLADNLTIRLYEDAMNLTSRAETAMEQGAYYSTASYCYGANVKFGQVILLEMDETDEEIFERIIQMEEDLEGFSVPEYRTITDLQAWMVVNERLNDARRTVELVKENLEDDDTETALLNLGYAIERKFSAYSWSMFITGNGREFDLTEDRMRDSCEKKISEAEERYQYVSLFFPTVLANLRQGIDDAYDDLEDGNYEDCLFKAAKTKAETDVILSVFGVEREDVEDLVDRKLDIVEKYIIKQSNDGVFPIVGFSYYEYAKDLKDTDVFSSLLYSEYALEMSNLDLYFKDSGSITITDQDMNEMAIFLIGLGAGMLIGVIVMIWHKRK